MQASSLEILRWCHKGERGRLNVGWGAEECEMCDYSLHNVKTRPAEVGDKLTTRDFGTGTIGFAASEDKHVAVCLVPGTELSLAEEVRRISLWPWGRSVIRHRTAIFRQINKDRPGAHHDALEFPDGQVVLLTFLKQRQQATVLQLPVIAAGQPVPQRAEYV